MILKKLEEKSKIFEDLLIKFITERLSSYPEVRRQSLYSINDTGILFRPSIFFTGININSKLDEMNYKDIAIAIELLQISTLIIDDIFDESPIRNGKKSMPEQFGIKNTIIIGELFRNLSNENIIKSRFLKDREKLKIMANLEDAYQKICIGQFLDLQYEKQRTITEKEYFDMISYTTGYFIQKSLLSGAIIAGVDAEIYSSLAQYGLKLGTAYQLRDDLVNILTDGSNGKVIAEDLIAHKKRLPVIYILNKSPYKNEFNNIWSKMEFSKEDISELLNIIVDSKSIDYCKSKLEDLCAESIKSIKHIKLDSQKNELIGLADLICSV